MSIPNLKQIFNMRRLFDFIHQYTKKDPIAFAYTWSLITGCSIIFFVFFIAFLFMFYIFVIM